MFVQNYFVVEDYYKMILNLFALYTLIYSKNLAFQEILEFVFNQMVVEI